MSSTLFSVNDLENYSQVFTNSLSQFVRIFTAQQRPQGAHKSSKNVTSSSIILQQSTLFLQFSIIQMNYSSSHQRVYTRGSSANGKFEFSKFSHYSYCFSFAFFSSCLPEWISKITMNKYLREIIKRRKFYANSLRFSFHQIDARAIPQQHLQKIHLRHAKFSLISLYSFFLVSLNPAVRHRAFTTKCSPFHLILNSPRRCPSTSTAIFVVVFSPQEIKRSLFTPPRVLRSSQLITTALNLFLELLHWSNPVKSKSRKVQLHARYLQNSRPHSTAPNWSLLKLLSTVVGCETQKNRDEMRRKYFPSSPLRFTSDTLSC